MQTSFFDIQWPPPPVDIPYVPYDPVEIGGIVRDSMFTSLRSIGDTGIFLFVNLVLVSLIAVLFRVLVLNRIRFFDAINRRVFNRKVKAADIQRHRNDIIQERVRDMELNSDAKEAYFIRNRSSMVWFRVRDMELNAEARRKYRSMHMQDDIQDALYRKVVNFAANKQFESQYTKEHNSYYKKRLKG